MMPDLVLLISRRWKSLLLLPLIATVLSFLALLAMPDLYKATATALPINTAIADRAHIFNPNIQGLYPELGSPDELDKVEGTARLDTIYSAAAAAFRLNLHYSTNTASDQSLQTAAQTLKKRTRISKTGYGELTIAVWDEQPAVAAQLANYFVQTINAIYKQAQTGNARLVLKQLQAATDSLQRQLLAKENAVSQFRRADDIRIDSIAFLQNTPDQWSLSQQLHTYQTLMAEYSLAIQTAPGVLTVIEPAQAARIPDKPARVATLLATFFAALLFSFLLLLFIEGRKKTV